MPVGRRSLSAVVGVAAMSGFAPRAAAANAADRGFGVSLDDTLRPYLARYDLPAVAAAVVQDGVIIAFGAVGTRRAGTDNPVTLNDRWHIGSDTKAMTSLLAAMLVEAGTLRWNTTVEAVFPELSGTMDARLKTVTLEQLLSHTSGIASDNDEIDRLIAGSLLQPAMNLDELRYWIVKQFATQPLQSAPGEKFAYANMGYVLVGAIIERKAGKTWEEMIVDRVFDPLDLKSAGLGPQSTVGRVDAPLGHLTLTDGALKPMLAGPDGDNPAVIGPAGVAHLSVLDFAKWAAWNAGEGRRGPALVSPETMRKMHTKLVDMPRRPDAAPGTPSSGSYGLGWGTITLPISSEPMLFHGGSNQMNLAYIMLQPRYDFGMVLVTNTGTAKADDALKALAAELYERFGKAR